MKKEKSRKDVTEGYAHVNIPKELAIVIDENIVGKLGYENRDEVVKEMIRKELPEYLKLSKKPETKDENPLLLPFPYTPSPIRHFW